MTTRYMRSTFAPRAFPMVIMLRDEGGVIGPFCVHCGAPEPEHQAGTKRCPSATSALYPAPACTCHGLAGARR